MKFSAILASALPPLSVISTPLVAVRDVATEASIEALRVKMASIASRDADARAIGLVKRYEHCDIVNVATTVDCWWLPKHGGNGNHKVESIAGTTNNIEFSCYTNCESVDGNTSWDWAVNRGCYVPGAYTDDTCTRANLGKCPFSATDRSYGGCSGPDT
ncbi:uncharacterized protein PAC_18746 [Phialocephala subalpina]|uniref:Uncharacterized protein n=1 Tax=Phialocephala subalpina TaxID=576137 RepID=A0A1L7XUY9_9HELO|nr:uncharacterized protein PAC_18746 [Phialocephala subalpina]